MRVSKSTAERWVDRRKATQDLDEPIPSLPKREPVWTPKKLSEHHHDPSKQADLEEIVTRVVTIAQVIAEKKFYPYQVEFSFRIVESLLTHDGETLTALMSRQSGKTETLSAIVAAIALLFPWLAKQFPEDWKLNITDDSGVYRGFRFGVKIGIYAPRMDQSGIMFERVKKAFDTDSCKRVMKEVGVTLDVRNGNTIILSNGSRILCESASEQSKIEGETHSLLIAEEAQDISDLKIRKSLSPMISSTLGTMVMIGTATTQKCDFYTTIRQNERTHATSQKRNHFFYPYTVAVKYNSLYSKYVEKEKLKLGESSDEFLMSYGCRWIFERGMFVTQEQLLVPKVAIQWGGLANYYPQGLGKHPNYSIIVGIDWGRSHDSTVLSFVAVDWNQPWDGAIEAGKDPITFEQGYLHYKKHLIYQIEFRGDDYETQFQEIAPYIDAFPNVKKIVTDSNTCGAPIFDRLASYFAGRIQVDPFNFNAKLKSNAYRSFYGDITAQRFTFPYSVASRKLQINIRFVHQMLDLRKSYKNGTMKVEHPNEKDAHDDYPDSVCMACWGANTPAYHGTIFYETNPFFT